MNDNKLRINWSKREKDLIIHYPSKPDGWLVYSFMSGDITFKEFTKELKERGYNIESFKMSIDK